MVGSYRDAGRRGACVVCEEESVGVCVRCGRSFCLEHLAVGNERCADCELHFAGKHRSRRYLVNVATAGLGVATGVAAVVAGPIALLVGGAAAAATRGAGAILRAVSRRRFLAEGGERDAIDSEAELNVKRGVERKPRRFWRPRGPRKPLNYKVLR